MRVLQEKVFFVDADQEAGIQTRLHSETPIPIATPSQQLYLSRLWAELDRAS